MFNDKDNFIIIKQICDILVNQADLQRVNLKQEEGRNLYTIGLNCIRGFEIRTSKEVLAMSDEERLQYYTSYYTFLAGCTIVSNVGKQNNVETLAMIYETK